MEPFTSLDQKIEKFEKILAGNPGDISVLMAYAEANLSRGRRLEALQAYQKVLDIKPDVVEVHIAIVKIYIFQSLYGEAFQQLARVFQLSPDNLEGHVLFRKLTKEARMPEELTGRFAGTDDYLPRKDALSFYRTQVRMEIEEREREISQIQKLLEESPDEPLLAYMQEMAKRRHQFAADFSSELGTWDEKMKAMEEEKILELEQKRQREREEQRILMLAEAAAAAVALLPEEIAPEPEEPVAAEPAIDAERLKYFESIQDNINTLTSALSKTKGVTAVMVADRDGFVVFRDMKEVVEEPIVSSIVRSSVEFLEEFRKGDAYKPYLYWVLEFEKGILVLRAISADFVLLAVGQAGTNFGALRFSVDKNKVSLEEVLAPAAKHPTQDTLLWEAL